MGKTINQVAALNKLIARQKREIAQLKKENKTLKAGIQDYYVQAQVKDAAGYYYGLEMGRPNAPHSKEDNNLAIKNLLNLLPGHVYWKDRYGIYLGCNDELAQLTGFKSSDEVVGKTVYDFLDEKLADAVTEADERIMLNNKEETIEEQGFDKDGNPAWYLTTKVPLRNNQGHVIGMLGLSFNISDRKAQENSLHEMNQRLLVLDKLKQNFLDNMSHSFKTPLNVLKHPSMVSLGAPPF